MTVVLILYTCNAKWPQICWPLCSIYRKKNFALKQQRFAFLRNVPQFCNYYTLIWYLPLLLIFWLSLVEEDALYTLSQAIRRFQL